MTNRLVLIDGECVLCSKSAQFIVDRTENYRFATLQSAQEYEDKLPTDSVLLFKDGKIYKRSDAAIEILKDIGLNSYLARTLQFIPRIFRDAVYDLVAAFRFRFFGKKTCRLEPRVREYIADEEVVRNLIESQSF